MDDLRAAFLAIARRPRFAAFVVLTLAVALAAATVIFGFVEALVLEPLPLGDPERVVLVFGENPRQGVGRAGASLPDFLDWREAAAASFEELAAGEEARASLATAAGPVPVRAQRVTANLFRAWGLAPLLGRGFAAGEDRPGAAPVVVLAHGFWSRRFGSDPGVLGRTLRLDGVDHTVVGVLGPEIEIGSLGLIDVWTPLPLDAARWPRGRRSLQVTGLLRQGVAVERADAEIRAASARLAAAHPETNDGWSARAFLFEEAMAVPQTWVVLGLASLAVALVVAAACAGVASLLLARGLDRRREVAVRLALGARRGRIVRPLLAEGLLLAVGGAAAGLLLARLGFGLVRAATWEPFFRRVGLDAAVVGFLAATALVTPLLFSLGPALAAARTPIAAALQGAAATASAGRGGRRARNALVVVQIALALALSALSFLAARSAVTLGRAELGFETAGLLVVQTELPAARYAGPAEVARFQERVEGALARLPGARAAGTASRLPALEREQAVALAIHGREAAAGERPWGVRVAVSPAYFGALGLELLAGRDFEPRDAAGRALAGDAVVGEEAARRFWGTPERAVGGRMRLDGGAWLEVAGVVADVRGSPRETTPKPTVYLPFAGQPERRLAFVVRAAGDPAGLATAARAAVRTIDPEQAVVGPRPFDEALHDALANDRLTAGFFTAFALITLALAAIGLYGLVSFAVAHRTGEIGIRMVLGARPAAVRRMVAAEGLRLAAAGIALGLAAAHPLTRAMRGAVAGAPVAAPALYTGLAALLAAVALLAAYLPARRASRLDPAAALRTQRG